MKVALLADLHIGVKSDDLVFYESQYRFYKDQLVPELKDKGINDIWILGDVFDQRKAITPVTITRVIDIFKNILSGFNIRIIVGNHDMFYNTDLDVNSLKILSLLPNITVYEKPYVDNIDGKSILFQPWIVDYSKEDVIRGKYDYCFAHMDIIGFDTGGGRPSEAGMKAAYMLDHAKVTYTGHYHTMVTRRYEHNQEITYLGAPYQLTRIDRDGKRGYHILDLATNEREFVENRVSIKFTKHVYPNVNMDMITGNVVDMDIPYEYYDQTKKISTYVEKLEKLKPAYPVNLNYLVEEKNVDDLDTDNLNLVSLFTNYIDQYETKVDKKKLYGSFIELYDTYKEQI